MAAVAEVGDQRLGWSRVALVPMSLGLLVSSMGCLELATFGSFDAAPDLLDWSDVDVTDQDARHDVSIVDLLDGEDDVGLVDAETHQPEVLQDTTVDVGPDLTDTGTLGPETSDAETIDATLSEVDAIALDVDDSSDTEHTETHSPGGSRLGAAPAHPRRPRRRGLAPGRRRLRHRHQTGARRGPRASSSRPSASDPPSSSPSTRTFTPSSQATS